MTAIWLLLGIAVGAAGAWLALRGRLADAFRALSADVLRSNNEAFLQLAKSELGQHQIEAREELEKRQRAVEQLVRPIGESLEKVDVKLEQLERVRAEAQGSLSAELRRVTETQDRLRRETANLVTALRSPVARGKWGEIQLRRVCELAGMVAYCDFVEQVGVGGDGGRLRPDVIVKLPGGKDVVIDAKAPLQAYLDAIEAEPGDDDVRRAHLQAHARQLRDHISKLGAKAYWSQFPAAPEFVVMFVPSEAIFSAALEQAPSLIEDGVAERVLVATPTTLIALLRAVAYGWRQERVAESARAVSELGRELHGRVGVFADHLSRLGRQLAGSVRAYNDAVGSFESRVLVTARKLSEHGAAADDELPAPDPVELAPREPRGVELPEPAAADEIKVRRLSR